ncbi:MAG: hypothetical protein ACI8P0_004273 [Planctomycetaceae bacterium]|jgi:hypothetical protein
MTHAESDEEHADRDSAVVDASEHFDVDRHRDLMTLLDNRVQREVPAEVTSAIRSSVAAELAVALSEPELHPETATSRSSFDRRRLLSLMTGTPALIVVFMALNVFVVWQNDQRVATVVGDQPTRTRFETTPHDATQLASSKPTISTLFEFNVSLIQRELNHERIDSHGTGTFRSRRKTIGPAEEENSKGIPESSGAAVCPRPGIQRFSQLAGWLRA